MTEATVSQLKSLVSESKFIALSHGDDKMSSHMAALERTGLARVGKGPAPEELWNSPGPRDSIGRALASLVEEREDGR